MTERLGVKQELLGSLVAADTPKHLHVYAQSTRMSSLSQRLSAGVQIQVTASAKRSAQILYRK